MGGASRSHQAPVLFDRGHRARFGRMHRGGPRSARWTHVPVSRCPLQAKGDGPIDSGLFHDGWTIGSPRAGGEGHERWPVSEPGKEASCRSSDCVDWPAPFPPGIAQWLRRADVLVLPSLFDGWGAVLNEGASAGKALISTTECGAAWHLIRHGDNGFRVQAGSEKALAQGHVGLHPEPGSGLRARPSIPGPLRQGLHCGPKRRATDRGYPGLESLTKAERPSAAMTSQRKGMRGG